MATKSYSRTRTLVECALMIAVGTVLAQIKIFEMPFGGSVTLVSMLPFILVSFRHGVKWGLATGFVNSLLQMLLGFYAPPAGTVAAFVGVVLLDYVLAFTLLGLAGVIAKPFKNHLLGVAAGTAAVCVIRLAAEDLGVSQALLSHYEKGIRECGLEFVVRVADYYGVSCDYLLGRSADRSGLTLSVEDIPSPEGAKDGVFRGSVLPTFNKKLISNSLNILYDKLNACPDKGLVGEISGYLMLAVYKMFRLVYGAGPKNTSSMFGVKKNLYGGYSDAAMHIAESNVKAILAGEDIGLGAPLKDTSAFAMTTESLSRDYPLYATSLLNLIKTSEARIEKEK